MWITLNNPRGWGYIHNRLSLLPFHAPYWCSFGHLSFLLIFLCPLCLLLFCLLATVLLTPCHSPTRAVLAHSGLPINHRLPLFNIELFLPGLCPCLHSSLCLHVSPLKLFSVHLLLGMLLVFLKYVWAAVLWDLLPACLQLWCVVVAQTGFRNGWTQLWLAHGSPPHRSLPQPPLLKSSHAWGKIS